MFGNKKNLCKSIKVIRYIEYESQKTTWLASFHYKLFTRISIQRRSLKKVCFRLF